MAHINRQFRTVFVVLNIALVVSEFEIECPDNPGPGEYLFPHQNCSLFYACENGHPQVMECPPGLYFNPELKVCDHPENVTECQGGTRPPSTTTATPPNDWIIIQRRGSVLEHGEVRQDFYLGWDDYVEGFGDLAKDFWLGLGKIAELTSNGDYELQIDMKDVNGVETYAKYDLFALDAEDSYRLKVVGFSGSAVDGFKYHNGMKFTTKDNDNDESGGGNCALIYPGAWWYKSCFQSDLNSIYREESTIRCEGLQWRQDFECNIPNVIFSEMKIRQRN